MIVFAQITGGIIYKELKHCHCTLTSLYLVPSHVYFESMPTSEKIKGNVFLRSQYRGADKSLARPTSRCMLFDGENISFDASFVIYIYK